MHSGQLRGVSVCAFENIYNLRAHSGLEKCPRLIDLCQKYVREITAKPSSTYFDGILILSSRTRFWEFKYRGDWGVRVMGMSRPEGLQTFQRLYICQLYDFCA